MKHALADMTWTEFRERLAENPVILIPLGSQEEQGPHAPMGDYVLAEKVTLDAAAKCGAICAPVLPFGYAEFFRGAPGGVQLRAKTFCSVLEDIVTSFLNHGVKHVVICNGHTTNASLILDVTYRLRRKRGIMVPSLNLWRALPADEWARLHGAGAGQARGHGADPLTSLYLHQMPDLMRMDQAAPAQGYGTALGLSTSSAVTSVMFNGGAVDLPLQVLEVSDNGVAGGDPRLASAEIGREIHAWTAQWIADFAEHFRRFDPCDPFAPLQP